MNIAKWPLANVHCSTFNCQFVERSLIQVYYTTVMNSYRTVAVILPAKNEAAAIAQVLSRIPRQIDGMNVILIVVADGSTDQTASIAVQSGAHVVRHLTNLGVGAATQTGFRAAQALNADVFVTMDADGQHVPAEIERLVRCLREGPYDVVIGSRLLTP